MRPTAAAVLVLLAGCGGMARPSAGPSALDLYSEARFEAAQSVLESSDPKDVLSRRLLGRILLLQNRLREAAPHLAEAVRLSRSDAMAVQDYVWAVYRLDDYARTSEGYRALTETVLAKKYAVMADRGSPYSSTWRDEEAGLPFFERSPLLIVQLRINGVGGLFVVDTTAGEMVLDREFAKRARVQVVGTGGQEEGIVDTVEMAGLQVRNVPGTVRTLERLGPRPVDGILGGGFLTHFTCTFDFRRYRLTLTRSGSVRPKPASETALYLAGGSHLLARGEIDGASALLLVHTGMAPAFVPSSAGLLRRSGLLREVKCGPLLPGATLDSTLFPPGLDYGYGFTIDGLLGLDAFRNRVVTLDLDRMRLGVD